MATFTSPLKVVVAGPKNDVEEAKRPEDNFKGEVVAEVVVPNHVMCEKGSVPPPPPPVPHAVPVFEIVPFTENVAHPAAPPALETMRFVVDAVVAVIAVVEAYVIVWRADQLLAVVVPKARERVRSALRFPPPSIG